jgi:murein DD-endopeptidase MepM/ murein hydrolase activator NlpD
LTRKTWVDILFGDLGKKEKSILRKISGKGIKLAFLAQKDKYRLRSKAVSAKAKVGYENFNVGEKVENVKDVSKKSIRDFLIELKNMLFRPVRQASHMSLVIVVILVLLTGIPAPKPANELVKKATVDPFGANEISQSTQPAEDKITASETVAMAASFISDNLANDAYEVIGNENKTVQLAFAGDAIANPKIATTTSSSKLKEKYTKYTVQPGDTLSGIATKYGVTSDSIKWSNGITNENTLKPGQELNIPSVTGIIYTVKSGDSLEGIASKFKTSSALILAQNDLYGEDLVVGAQVIVPDGIIEAPAPTPAPKVATTSGSTSGSGRYGSSAPIGRTGSFRFPTIVGRSGYYNGYHWWAIDIPNSIGTPIYAADSGQIVEAKYGYNGGYGNTILINHGAGFSTRYAHMSTLLILGGYVTKGQVIGYMGSTGRSTGSHLHFEVMVNGAKQNPLKYL